MDNFGEQQKSILALKFVIASISKMQSTISESNLLKKMSVRSIQLPKIKEIYSIVVGSKSTSNEY